MPLVTNSPPCVQVPYEVLNKRFRSSQKVVDREVNHVSTVLTDLEKQYTGEQGDRAAALQQLDRVKEQLRQLRDKGLEAVDQVLETANICKR